MKQIPVSEHKTPTHDADVLRNQRRAAIEASYGHLFKTCQYCGWYHHNMYVCGCGVDTGYLEDADGATVRPLVPVYEIPEKE